MPETDIFISYSRDDREKARVVATCLEREGFVVWWDAAIHSGESFDMVIERQLQEAKAVVVLWSPSSVNSRWVRAEAASADRDGKLAPVIIAPCVRPIIFEMLHTVDLSHWNGDMADPSWAQFLLDLHRTTRSKRRHSAPTAHGMPREMPAQFEPPIAAESITPPPAPVQVPPPAPAPLAASPSLQVEEEDDDDEEAYEATQFSIIASPARLPEHFLHLIVDGKAEKQFPVMGDGIRIGRSAPADVILDDKHVSRRHCRVELKGDDLVVVDLGSTNGTYVDDEKVSEPVVLPVGSILKVGQCELVHQRNAQANV